jgi:hypothetical protein
MFIVFPRLLADILGFSGAVGLSVIVSAMEVRMNIKGGHIVNQQFSGLILLSQVRKFLRCASQENISAFFY